MTIIETELPDIEYVGSPPTDTPVSTGTGKRRGRPPGSANKASLEKIQADLAEKIAEAAAPIGVMSPLAGAVIDQRADRTAKALVTIAGNSPRFKKNLEAVIRAGAIFDIVMFPMSIAVAMMIDFGKIAPDAVGPKRMGITNLYHEVYPDDTPSDLNGYGTRVAPVSGLYS